MYRISYGLRQINGDGVLASRTLFSITLRVEFHVMKFLIIGGSRFMGYFATEYARARTRGDAVQPGQVQP